MDRAHGVRPDLEFDDATRETVLCVCRRLDGLPLAIELAAARCRILEPGELLARLRQGLPLLTGGELDGPTRHRTLRAALAWSHELLSEQERVLFRRLAVFVSGFALQKLSDADDSALVRERHAGRCLQVGERARAELSGPREGDQRQRLMAEQDDVRAALAWAIAAGFPDRGLRLASAL